MPNKPKRPCRYPMCPAVIDSKDGYCETHRKQVSKNYEKTRETAVKRGYDTRWQAVRKMVLRRHSLCQCLSCQNNGQKLIANMVHHLDRDPKNNRESNLLAMNDVCHNKLHANEGDRW